jgi:hypothetical protein
MKASAGQWGKAKVVELRNLIFLIHRAKVASEILEMYVVGVPSFPFPSHLQGR